MKIGVMLSVCAVLILIAGWEGAAAVRRMQSAAPNASLDSVEIDDWRVALPKTELVTCGPLGPDDFLFSWTGSDEPAPHHPLEQTEAVSQVAVDFTAETADVKSLDLRLFFRGSDLEVREPPRASADPLRLVRSGLHRYLLVGMAEAQPALLPSLFYLRIELHCAA